MIFQISPKLSVARDLLQIYRQTVPQTRPCNSKAPITKTKLLTGTKLLHKYFCFEEYFEKWDNVSILRNWTISAGKPSICGLAQNSTGHEKLVPPYFTDNSCLCLFYSRINVRPLSVAHRHSQHFLWGGGCTFFMEKVDNLFLLIATG